MGALKSIPDTRKLQAEGKLGPKYPAIMDSFIEPIGGFISFLAIGVICGGLCFVLAYRNMNN